MMDVELGGFLSQNDSFDYDDDYEYVEESQSEGSKAVLIPLLYAVVMVTGLLGNGLICGVLALRRARWRPSDTLVLHLCVTDVLLLLTLSLWAAQAAQPSGWSFGNALCKISGVLFHINFYFGLFMLVCISLDRCLTIAPTSTVRSGFLHKPTLAHLSCLVVWLFSLLLTIPDWMFLTDERISGTQKTMCVHSFSEPLQGLFSRLPHHVLGFLVPVLMLIYLCHKLLLEQCRSKGLQKEGAVGVILPLVAVFLLCWMPHSVALIVDTSRTYGNATSRPKGGSLRTELMVTSAVACVHASLRPLLYLRLCANFRKRALYLLRCEADESGGSLWDLGSSKEAKSESQSQEVMELKRGVWDVESHSTQCT